MFYPFTFEPNYKDYIWGGRRLADFGKKLPEEGNVAESWELSSHPNGPSVIADGALKGRTFQSVIDEFGTDIIGTGLSERDQAKFPLLIKLIDAKDNLSIQVHPDDQYAHEHENGEYGKNEMWIVLAAPPNAKLIVGVKDGITREDFARAIEDDKVMDSLQAISVRPGDAINIPAGMVHAITGGLVIYEVQQNSDTTYRVYDYNRPGADGQPRELHVDKALDVINFEEDVHTHFPGLSLVRPFDAGPGTKARRLLVANRYFAVEYHKIPHHVTERTDGSRFYAYTVAAGDGTLTYMDEDGAPQKLQLSIGKTVFIPAALGEYTWDNADGTSTSRPLELICSYIPDWDILLNDIKTAGVQPQQLPVLVGVQPLADSLKELLDNQE